MNIIFTKDKNSRFDDETVESQRRHVVKYGITLVSMLRYFRKIEKKMKKKNGEM